MLCDRHVNLNPNTMAMLVASCLRVIIAIVVDEIGDELRLLCCRRAQEEIHPVRRREDIAARVILQEQARIRFRRLEE